MTRPIDNLSVVSPPTLSTLGTETLGLAHTVDAFQAPEYPMPSDWCGAVSMFLTTAVGPFLSGSNLRNKRASRVSEDKSDYLSIATQRTGGFSRSVDTKVQTSKRRFLSESERQEFLEFVQWKKHRDWEKGSTYNASFLSDRERADFLEFLRWKRDDKQASSGKNKGNTDRQGSFRKQATNTKGKREEKLIPSLFNETMEDKSVMSSAPQVTPKLSKPQVAPKEEVAVAPSAPQESPPRAEVDAANPKKHAGSLAKVLKSFRTAKDPSKETPRASSKEVSPPVASQASMPLASSAPHGDGIPQAKTNDPATVGHFLSDQTAGVVPEVMVSRRPSFAMSDETASIASTQSTRRNRTASYTPTRRSNETRSNRPGNTTPKVRISRDHFGVQPVRKALSSEDRYDAPDRRRSDAAPRTLAIRSAKQMSPRRSTESSSGDHPQEKGSPSILFGTREPANAISKPQVKKMTNIVPDEELGHTTGRGEWNLPRSSKGEGSDTIKKRGEKKKLSSILSFSKSAFVIRPQESVDGSTTEKPNKEQPVESRMDDASGRESYVFFSSRQQAASNKET